MVQALPQADSGFALVLKAAAGERGTGWMPSP
jgi:hypothetical protein